MRSKVLLCPVVCIFIPGYTTHTGLRVLVYCSFNAWVIGGMEVQNDDIIRYGLLQEVTPDVASTAEGVRYLLVDPLNM